MAVQEKDLRVERAARRAFNDLTREVKQLGEDIRRRVHDEYEGYGHSPEWFGSIGERYHHPSELSWLETYAHAYNLATGQELRVGYSVDDGEAEVRVVDACFWENPKKIKQLRRRNIRYESESKN